MKFKIKFRVSHSNGQSQKFAINLAEGASLPIKSEIFGLGLPLQDSTKSNFFTLTLRDQALIAIGSDYPGGFTFNKKSGHEFSVRTGDFIECGEYTIEFLETPPPQQSEEASGTQFMDISEIHKKNKKMPSQSETGSSYSAHQAANQADAGPSNEQSEESGGPHPSHSREKSRSDFTPPLPSRGRGSQLDTHSEFKEDKSYPRRYPERIPASTNTLLHHQRRILSGTTVAVLGLAVGIYYVAKGHFPGVDRPQATTETSPVVSLDQTPSAPAVSAAPAPMQQNPPAQTVAAAPAVVPPPASQAPQAPIVQAAPAQPVTAAPVVTPAPVAQIAAATAPPVVQVQAPDRQLASQPIMKQEGEPYDRLASDQFFAAIKAGNVSIVKSLISKKAVDPDFTLDHGSTPLMYAAARGRETIVDYLLASKVNPNAKDPSGTTALMWAAYSGHRKVVEALLRYGADTRIRREDGDRAVDIAGRWNHPDIVEVLKRSAERKIASKKNRPKRRR